jgi:(+)-neomenthol dehydrogenase
MHTLTQLILLKSRLAAVTGANRGIGLAICKQLVSNCIKVVLAARDEKRGVEAVDKLKDLALPGLVVFHQLDVTDPTSIGSFADFVKNQFGKLDILV